MATAPETSNLFNGVEVPIPIFPIVPTVSVMVRGRRVVPVLFQYPKAPEDPPYKLVIYPLAKYLEEDPKSRVLLPSGPMFPATSNLKRGFVVQTPTFPPGIRPRLVLPPVII